jgi:hypothetical protein
VYYGFQRCYDIKEVAEREAAIFDASNFITTLCIEKQNGRWVLVDGKGGDK